MNESKQKSGRTVGQENDDQQNTADFLHKLSDILDQSVEEMDASTKARLRDARREAVAASEEKSYAAWLMPVGSLAAAATVAVLTVSLWMTPPDEGVNAQLSPLEDFALLSDSESLEFYQDLDFYLWLDDEQKAG